MTYLLNIPFEILLQITSYLTTPEYGYLRRTCKQLEATLFGVFTKEFFSKRHFAMVEFSLQALVDISKSRLGPSLTHLIIRLGRPVCFQEDHRRRIPPELASWAITRNHAYAECVSFHELITSGSDLEMLTEAIKNLPNLETIGMRDFDSESRHRDRTSWNGYGCPSKLRNIHFILSIGGDFDREGIPLHYPSHVFLTILRAMGNAAVSGYGTKLTRFEVILHTCLLRDQAFKIPDRLSAGIQLALNKLTTIFLDGLYYTTPNPYVVSGSHGKASQGYLFFFSRFLVRLPALEHLRINFRHFIRNGSNKFLKWLAKAREESSDATSTSLCSLSSANVSNRCP
ncbi:hypothetical protein GGR50DRAFT_655384 [Xylaria sp. CBS 124048]|nr:hypothetical protein GGR50DRAFT_655384 [Xylaria sp. CBS 124048]